MPSDAIQIESYGSVSVVYLGSEFEQLSKLAQNQLNEFMIPLLDQALPPRIVFDLKALRMCDPRLLAALVRLQNSVRQKHGWLALSGLQQPVRNVLSLTKLDRVLMCEKSVCEAIQNMSTSTDPPDREPTRPTSGGHSPAETTPK